MKHFARYFAGWGFTVKRPKKKNLTTSRSTLVVLFNHDVRNDKPMTHKTFQHSPLVNIYTMEARNFQLETVKERWPDYKDHILSLYYTDNKFRAICEDYYLCMKHLDKFRKEFSEKLQTIEEYEKMRQELEVELQGRIDNDV